MTLSSSLPARAVLLLAAAGLTVLFAYLSAESIPHAILYAPAVVVGAALLLVTSRRPRWLFPAVAALSPVVLALPVLGAQVIPADVLVICLVLAWLFAGSRRTWNEAGWTVAMPLGALIVLCLVTLPISSNVGFGLVKIAQRLEFLLLFAATVALLRDGAMMRLTVGTYVLSCIVLAAVTLVYGLTQGIQAGGVNLLFYNKNAIAYFLAVALPLVLARLLFGVPRRQLLWGAAAIVLGAGLVVSGSRGAWIAVAVAAAPLVAWRRRAALWPYAAVLVALVVVANTLLPPSLTRFSEFVPSNTLGPNVTAATGGTVLSRLILWRDALGIIAAHPLLGVGVGGYISYDTFQGNTYNFNTNDPHNAILYFWAELGTGGLLVFLWLVSATFRSAARATQAAGDGETRWLALGILAALLSYMVFSLTEPIWTRGDGLIFFMLVGMAVNLASLGGEEWRQRAGVPASDPMAERQALSIR